MQRGAGKLGLIVVLGLALAIVAAIYFLGQSPGAGRESGPDAATVLQRERVAHWFKEDKLARAREVLAPLVSSSDAQAEDLIRAAAIEYSLSEAEAAAEFLARAEALEPDSPALHFLRGQIARESGDPEAAVVSLRRAYELAPNDLPTAYILAQALRDMDEFDEAEAMLRLVVDAGIENAGSWYVSALYGLERLLFLDGRDEEAEPLSDRRNRLKEAGISPLSSQKTRLGTFGKIAPPEPTGNLIGAPQTDLKFFAKDLGLPLLAGALELRAHDIDGDGRVDLLARLKDGLAIAMHSRSGWTEERIYNGAVSMVRAYDLDNEPEADLELLIVDASGMHMLENGEEGWQLLEVQFPSLPSAARDIEPLDFDHEGDIDLLLVGDFGARLWRNDGAWVLDAETPGAYVDATNEASLPQGIAYDWALSEDFDGDNDVDLLFGGESGFYLASSLRAGHFEDQSMLLPKGASLPQEPLVADFNGDARADIFRTGPEARLFKQSKDRSFLELATSATPGLNATVTDIDLDGSADIVWGFNALLAVGLEQEVLVKLATSGTTDESLPMAVLDVDGDRKLDLVQTAGTGLVSHSADGERGNSMNVVLRGNRSNRRGMGSIVAIRTGTTYRRIYYRGEPVTAGVGSASSVDVVRITYPNGTIQSEIDVDLDRDALIDDPGGAFDQFVEPADQVGSCPFLYTWNGESYVFISDVLGITPLGLPMAPGMMVPPDHDEFVLVSSKQLKPVDGMLKMQFTEELREVTYLDRLRLDVIDHPEGTAVYPNELFKFPPFPEEHLHSVENPEPVVRATGSDGLDWTAQLAELDDDHAMPFTNQAPQFQGLAEPWFLELEFDPEAIRDAKKLRLVLTGWFFWSDASANMAAARHPGVDFIPPIFQVPDGNGGWRDTGPPVGFPAGKTKTMLIDVSEIGLQSDPRMRIFCSLQLYWDRVVLATDNDDAERNVVSLEPTSAMLTRRGFSAPIATENPGLPARFDWNILSEEPRWNPHPGKYTKLGECHELLHAIDDRYIVMGTGESLEVHFDASELPDIPAGYRRDYLVFLDGWAKDRDHNTLEALTVEPLPFHGMSGYPYTAEENFPTDEEHQEWRRKWNTRDAEDWILPLTLDD
ncbi:MAG: tetratricopeptide (TPR) repeat protein [Planctomycetota bacterium]|jgi:tetratricopeptide (TPR) repeat protein